MKKKGTRRLCAIMFADIVGYTALMQSDEAHAIATRSRFQQTIESSVAQADGEVVQFWGDGALSIFPSAVEAVRCALTLQHVFHADPMVPVRVGVHVGDIVRDAEGAWGDGVNVSARVQALAVPGSVLLSERVVTELKNQPTLEVAPLGPFELKNVAAPLGIFALVDAGIAVPDRAALEANASAPVEPAQPSTTQRWRRLALIAGVVALIASGGAWLVYKTSRVQWATDMAIPQIDRLIAQQQYVEAVSLAERAEQYIPADERLAGRWPRMARTASLTAVPTNARISMSEVRRPSVESERSVLLPEEWVDLGVQPIQLERLPLGIFRLRFTAPGFDTLEAIYDNPYDAGGRSQRWWGTLSKEGTIRPGFAPIGPKRFGVSLLGMPADYTPVPGGRRAPAYLISKYEVTNAEYKAFVDAGGYRERDYWNVDFVRDGEELTWEEAMEAFRDRSGRPGPSSWDGGAYPEGQDDYPVGGVSWYEAAAYAEFAGASLPTLFHWFGAAEYRGFDMAGFGNFRGQGPMPVGATPFGAFGIYDLAGNVREWTWNRAGETRYLLGGGWSDPLYMYGHGGLAPPFDRSAMNGFRLADYKGSSDAVLAPYRAPIDQGIADFVWGSESVDDEIFQVLARQYDYDRLDLASALDSVEESSRYWRKERVSFNAAYDGERVSGYLFVPRNVEPPFQTLIYFPGAGSMVPSSSERLDGLDMIDHVVKTGRAVFHPIYKDTYERSEGLSQNRGPTRDYVDRKIQWIQDVRRAVDYLETRGDIDTDRLAYWGISWGAEHGPIALATDPRLKAAVLMDGGAVLIPVLPEADESRFAPRVRVPVLMINGTFDFIFPVETAQRPFFDLLGTPPADKTHLLYEAGHIVVNRHFDEAMGAMVDWLDRYFGRVQ